MVFEESVTVDPDIVHTLMLTYPELDREFHWKKKLLLFGSVLPLLYERKPRLVCPNDVLGCRAVCRTWRAGVNRFLDSQPWLEPLIPNVHSDSGVLRREIIGDRRVLIHFF